MMGRLKDRQFSILTHKLIKLPNLSTKVSKTVVLTLVEIYAMCGINECNGADTAYSKAWLSITALTTNVYLL